MKKILIIEDDRTFAETLKTALEPEGLQIELANDGDEGLRLVGMRPFDLIVLDVALPGQGGFDVCRELRAKGNWTPLVMISGQKKEEIDKVLGLELGADDYLQKPFGARELLARIRAVLRRGTAVSSDLEEYAFGDVRLDFKTQTATKGGRTVHLTAKEFALLRLLVGHEDEVVGREQPERGLGLQKVSDDTDRRHLHPQPQEEGRGRSRPSRPPPDHPLVRL